MVQTKKFPTIFNVDKLGKNPHFHAYIKDIYKLGYVDNFTRVYVGNFSLLKDLSF